MQSRISNVPSIQTSSPTHTSISVHNENEEDQPNTTRLLLEAPTQIRTSPKIHESLVQQHENSMPSSPCPSETGRLPSQINNEVEQVTQLSLGPMNSVFKQTFHDEVVTILDHLPVEQQFDITQNFTQQLNHVFHVTIPAIKALISPRLMFTDDELIAIIRQLHKSRRGKWKSREKLETHRARRRTSSRTTRVSILFFILSNISLVF